MTLMFLAQLTSSDGAAAAPSISLFEYVNSGGVLSYVLVLLSIVALALGVRNLLVLRVTELAPPMVIAELDRLLRANDVGGVLRFTSQQPASAYLANIFRRALERVSRSTLGMFEFRAAIEEAGQAETDRLHRMNDGIGIIAAVAPMLGLLGTVIGMIGAFHSIGALEGAARSSELAKFMSMALVNTAEGLIVAIPCTVVFALFRRRIDRLVDEIGKTAEGLIGVMGAPGAAARADTPAMSAPTPQRPQGAPGAPLRSAAPRGIVPPG